MSEPTKADLVARAAKAGVEGDLEAMTKPQLEEALAAKAAQPGRPAVPPVQPETAGGPEEGQPAESDEGVTFGDDEFSTQQLIESPSLVLEHIPDEVRHGFSVTALAVALRRDDPDRVFWTVEDAGKALTKLLAQPVE